MTEQHHTTADVLVLGGGISGLTAAWKAQRAGKRVVLLEGSERLGGCIHTLDVGEARFDAGATSTLLKHESVRGMLREAALEGLVLEPPPEAKKRFILRHGRLHPLPLGPLGLLGTPLFSAGDKLRLLGEPFRAPAPLDAEESIADFAARRLGRSFLANAVAPFVSGVWAGDPARLAVRWAAPALWRLEQEHGSLIRGALARRSGPGPRGKLVNFRGGMQALPEALGERLGEAVRRGHAVERVRREDGAFVAEGHSPDGAFTFRAPRLVCALPGHALPDVLAPLGAAAEAFRQLPYASVASVFLVYSQAAAAAPVEGFGFLRGAAEGSARLLGCIFTNRLWPDRAPAGALAFTCFYGGRNDPEAASLPESELTALAHQELAPLLALRGEPQAAAAHRWQPAIPQMETGHGRILAAAAALVQENPGLSLVGNYLEGVSVADCIDRALRLDL
jgi:oxygen-dependent protoporphyrinogen oxidase